jgi:hypothetical protein
MNLITYVFDPQQKTYTACHEIVPHFYGEGRTKEEAFENMITEAIELSEDYVDNEILFSPFFDTKQNKLINEIIGCSGNRDKIRNFLVSDK